MAYIYYYIYILNKYYKGALVCAFLLSPFCSFAQYTEDVQIANEYLLKGDKEKALSMYQDLARNDANIPLIHNNYMNVMLDLNRYDEARDYLKKVMRREPQNLLYKMDQAVIWVRSGDLAKADRHIKDLIKENQGNVQSVKMMADYLSSRSLNEYAVLALKESRQYVGNPYLFSLDLAMLYRIQGEKDKMVQEYLTYVTQSSANIQYVKNVMQALLSKPDELESLERILYERVQKNPDVEVYADLLIWVTLQQKNFYSSFIQARAYDKRYKKEGEKTMEVARVALDNEDYQNAARIYRYVAREFPGTSNYLLARLGLIKTREAEIKSSYPVNKDSVATLIRDYENFIQQYPDNTYSLEAQRSEALLYANYLDEKQDAIRILQNLIANPKATTYLKSKSRLDLGDIYLLKGEPWESTLLYSQVEKLQKENPIGYEAKLKNAKLSYFKGDFRLAQEHLDILKEATTREISNDAMELSMRIKENIAFDSSGLALQEFAAIELLMTQNKIDEALEALASFGSGKDVWMSAEDAFRRSLTPLKEKGPDSVLVRVTGTMISGTAIQDDVYWLEANLRLQRGEFEKAVERLQKILDEYSSDVLADDAYFLQGEIYERHLKDTDKAMEVYRDFLTRFPGSVFTAEARKRFRNLRGDFQPKEPSVPFN